MKPIRPDHWPSQSEERSWSPDFEFLECGIDGDRFGIATSHVRHTDVWRSDYLESLAGTSIGVVGQTLWDGRWLPVLDLRQLFCLDSPLDPSDAQMFLVAEDHDERFILLLDGPLSIQCAPLSAFKAFTPLYVSDIRWLSGGLMVDDAVILMLDMAALNAHSQADGDWYAGMETVSITAQTPMEDP